MNTPLLRSREPLDEKPARAAPRIRCRQAAKADEAAIARLLARGFPERSPAYWTRALRRLDEHRAPPDCPKYGYVLDADGELVGVILLIFSTGASAASVRCNISSWYVEPAFRGYASFLIAHATRRKNTTYVNVSPAPHTRRTIEMQGFSRYSDGQFCAVPMLSRPRRDAHIRIIAADDPTADPEGKLLAIHAGYGCLSLMCDIGGRSYPFIFRVRRFANGFLAAAQLIYCRDADDLSRCAGPLGWFLLKRGLLYMIMNANGRVQGLIGYYVKDKAPRYYKGLDRPLLSDMTFTEIALFGF